MLSGFHDVGARPIVKEREGWQVPFTDPSAPVNPFQGAWEFSQLLEIYKRLSPQRVLEFHLFDFDRDLYGEDVELRFLHYLRPERKFENLAALREQIARDVSAARKIFAGSGPLHSA